MATPREVHVGRDGWLFWTGDPDFKTSFYKTGYRRFRWRTWRLVWFWLRRIETRARRCRALGARYVQAFAPDKLSVYADKVTGEQRVDPRCGVAARLARWSPHVVDLVAPLTSARAGADTYLRTDTHWTSHGYLAAYLTLCRGLGARPAVNVAAASHEPRTVYGDLGRPLDAPPEAGTELRFAPCARRVSANALVELRERLHGAEWAPGLMVGSRIVFANDDADADARRLLLFGDSYTFHATGLAVLMAETFCEVHALWSASLDWAYLERMRPDLVLQVTAERFTFFVEPDGLDVEAFAATRVAAYESPAAPSASA